MNILALDVGFAATGCAVLDEQERILDVAVVRTERTAKKRGIYVADDDSERCRILTAGLVALLDKYAPKLVVCELPTGGAQGARANRCMGLATGVATATLELRKIATAWVQPIASKRLVRAKGPVTKEEVEAVVLKRWPGLAKHPIYATMPKCESEHVADALAAYLVARDTSVVRVLLGAKNE